MPFKNPYLYLAFARRVRGFTQTELARAVGVPLTFLSAWECGDSLPTADQLARLAEVLDIPADLVMRPVELPTINEPTESEAAS